MPSVGQNNSVGVGLLESSVFVDDEVEEIAGAAVSVCNRLTDSSCRMILL